MASSRDNFSGLVSVARQSGFDFHGINVLRRIPRIPEFLDTVDQQHEINVGHQSKQRKQGHLQVILLNLGIDQLPNALASTLLYLLQRQRQRDEDRAQQRGKCTPGASDHADGLSVNPHFGCPPRKIQGLSEH